MASVQRKCEQLSNGTNHYLFPPGHNARPDDQGDMWTCTLHSIAKAIVDGCQDKVFRRDQEIDLSQTEVKNELLKRYVVEMIKDKKIQENIGKADITEEQLRRYLFEMIKDGKFPTEFQNGPNESEAAMTKLRNFVGGIIKDGGKWPEKLSNQNFEFVDQQTKRKWFLRLHVFPVTKADFIRERTQEPASYTHLLVYLNSSNTFHCVYAKSIFEDNDGKLVVKAINSYKNDPEVYKSVNQNRNIFYAVFCAVQGSIEAVQPVIMTHLPESISTSVRRISTSNNPGTHT